MVISISYIYIVIDLSGDERQPQEDNHNQAMKDNHKKTQTAIRNGCGKYDEIKDEKEFFQAAKDNKKMLSRNEKYLDLIDNMMM